MAQRPRAVAGIVPYRQIASPMRSGHAPAYHSDSGQLSGQEVLTSGAFGVAASLLTLELVSPHGTGIHCELAGTKAAPAAFF